MRVTFLLLVLANLAFLAWAALVDVTAEPPEDGISRLPRLQLLSEVRAPQPSASQPSATHPSGPASGAPGVASGAPGATSGVPGPANGGATGMNAASSQGVPSSGASQSPLANPDPAVSPTVSASTDRCVTIGPFSDLERASEATELLRQRGFSPRPRVETPRQPAGYWVYIGGLGSQSAETSTVRRLKQNGLTDARIMPASDEEQRRVSVGLFTRRKDAERRARAVRGLGLEVQIEEQHPAQAAHWVDVSLDASTQALPAASLLALEEDGSRLEIAECPSSAPPAAAGVQPSEAGTGSERPATGSAAGSSTGTASPPMSRPALSRPLAAQRLPQPD